MMQDDLGWKWLAAQMVLTNGVWMCEPWFKTPDDSFLAKCGEWMEGQNLFRSQLTDVECFELNRAGEGEKPQ